MVPKIMVELDANILAVYLSALSDVDYGVIEKKFNNTYNIEIGRFSPFISLGKKGSHYIMLELIKDGKIVGKSKKVLFTGKLAIECKGSKCERLENITHVLLTKDQRGIVISKEWRCMQPGDEWLKAKIEKYANIYNVDKALVMAVMASESNFRHCDEDGFLVSPAGAIGYMQIMPTTADSLGIDAYNPEENIEGGVRYLSQLINKFKDYGDSKIMLTLASYNCGPKNIEWLVNKYCTTSNCWEIVERHIDEKCKEETKVYVKRTLCYYEKCFSKRFSLRCEVC